MVLRLHLSEEQKEARSSQEQDLIQLLKDSLYVDDCISSLPSKDEAESFCTTSTALLKKAGMDLRKWRTNFGLVDEQASQKVLGISWNEQDDYLLITLEVSWPKIWTRRKLIKCVPQMFDPLGFVALIILQSKIFL